MQFCKGEGGVKVFREQLQPFRETLQEYQFLGGTSPCYADMYLFSFFMVIIPVYYSISLVLTLSCANVSL